jgi:hypothetical protein
MKPSAIVFRSASVGSDHNRTVFVVLSTDTAVVSSEVSQQQEVFRRFHGFDDRRPETGIRGQAGPVAEHRQLAPTPPRLGETLQAVLHTLRQQVV